MESEKNSEKEDFQRLGNISNFRLKLMYTACLYCCAFVFGWVKGQIGPSLPDLRIIAGIDIKTTSWIFITYYSAFVCGGLISFLLFSKTSRKLILSTCNFVLCCTIVSIPWCPNVLSMLCVFFMTGTAQGVIDPTINAKIIQIWNIEGKNFVFGLNTILSLGTIVSPLATAPFLELNATTSKKTQIKREDRERAPTIYIAFLITSSLALSAAIFVFVVYLISRNKTGNRKTENENQHEKSRTLPRSMRVITYVIIGLFMFLSSGIEEIFVGYLTTFCVTYMGWMKRSGAQLTSLLNVFFLIGRLSTIIISRWISTPVHTGIHCLTIVIAFVGFLFSAIHQADFGIWIFASLYGFGTSAVMPLLLCWCNEYLVPMSGELSSFVFLTAFTGSAVNPFLVRHVMRPGGSVWFCYLFLFESVTLLLTYSVGFFFTKYIVMKYGKALPNSKEYETIES